MKTAVMAVGLALAGCGSPELEQLACKAVGDETTTIQPSRAGVRYFPESLGQPSYLCGVKCQPVISKVESAWYPRHWDAAAEPSLYTASQQPMRDRDFILRFTWLRTFRHPVFVRVSRSGDRTRLIATEMSGKGGYDPGRAQRRVERGLSKADADALAKSLSHAAVFEQPSATCGFGMDGAQWIFERADQRGYRFVQRRSPEAGPSRELGEELLKLTGWTFDEVY